MASKSKPSLHYVMHRRNEHGYGLLDIELLTETYTRDGNESHVIGHVGRDGPRMTWQATLDKSDGSWYGFSIDVSAQSADGLMQSAATMARVVRKARADGYEPTPVEVLAALNKMGTRVVRDPRLSGYVTPENVADLSLSEYYAPGDNGYTLGNVLAADEKDARRKLAVELASRNIDNLKSWLASGEPVKQAYHFGTGQPDMRTPEEMLTI